MRLALASPRPFGFWQGLSVLLLLKLVLSIGFFVGVVRQYGEEDTFVSLALPSNEPGRTYLSSISQFRDVRDWQQWKGDPGDMYAFRISALYPNTVALHLFGNSVYALTAWSMACGLGSVLAIALIGRQLGTPAAGLFSGAVLSLIPGHILYSARVDTDIPQLFFLSFAILFLVLALKASSARAQKLAALGSGLTFGLLYLAKLLPSVLGLSWALLLPFALCWMRDANTLRLALAKWRQASIIGGLLLAGFLVVFVAENVLYHRLTGHWLLHWRIMKGNAINIESWRTEHFLDLGRLRLWLPRDGCAEFFTHARLFGQSLFPARHFSDLYQTPIHGWSWILLAPCMALLAWLKFPGRKLAWLVIGGFVAYYIYQEFLWVYPKTEEGRLTLTYVHKVHRFIYPCYLGIALACGLALGHWFRPRPPGSGACRHHLPRLAAAGALVAFAIANYPCTVYFHRLFTGSLADIRRGIAEVGAIAPNGAQVYIPAGTEPFYQLYQYPKRYALSYFPESSPALVREGWAILGGSLGRGLSSASFIEQYPPWLRPYYEEKEPCPSGWTLHATTPSTIPDDHLPPVRVLKIARLLTSPPPAL
ncbi:MAG: glycosyltransferase family 39 protein [Opitutaceae bacterium]|nr:glycosyltransferase family 39 protein [Opitutaceae bacterium]